MASAVVPVRQVKIDSIEHDLCKEFKTAISENEELDLLCLAGNSYGLGFFKEAGPLLKKLKSVKKVVLSDIFVSRKEEILPSLEILSESLAAKGVAYLDLSSNALCPDGVAAVHELVSSNPVSFLLFDHVALSREGSTSLCKSIDAKPLNLKTLRICKNRIEDRADDFAKTLATQTELEELVIYQNHIKGEQMLHLVESLLNCPKLKILDLSDNYIPSEALDVLLKVISQAPELETLNIADCFIKQKDGDRFFAKLGELQPSNLKTLFFNYNDVSNLKKAAEALKNLPKLAKLEFKHTDHEEDEIEEVKQILPDVEAVWESADEDEDEETDDKSRLQKEIDSVEGLLEQLASLKIN